jgi:hypothetical protein
VVRWDHRAPGGDLLADERRLALLPLCDALHRSATRSIAGVVSPSTARWRCVRDIDYAVVPLCYRRYGCLQADGQDDLMQSVSIIL